MRYCLKSNTLNTLSVNLHPPPHLPRPPPPPPPHWVFLSLSLSLESVSLSWVSLSLPPFSLSLSLSLSLESLSLPLSLSLSLESLSLSSPLSLLHLSLSPPSLSPSPPLFPIPPFGQSQCYRLVLPPPPSSPRPLVFKMVTRVTTAPVVDDRSNYDRRILKAEIFPHVRFTLRKPMCCCLPQLQAKGFTIVCRRSYSEEVSVTVRSRPFLRLFVGKVAVSKRGFCVGQECQSTFVGKVAVSKRGFWVGQECQSTIVCGKSCCQ